MEKEEIHRQKKYFFNVGASSVILKKQEWYKKKYTAKNKNNF
jgi:hypothetical protein